MYTFYKKEVYQMSRIILLIILYFKNDKLLVHFTLVKCAYADE